MGVRCQIGEGDIKLSGAIAQAALNLGFLTRSEEYPNCFVENRVAFTVEQVDAIICEVLSNDNIIMYEIDSQKLDVLYEWSCNAEDGDTLVFC